MLHLESKLQASQVVQSGTTRAHEHTISREQIPPADPSQHQGCAFVAFVARVGRAIVNGLKALLSLIMSCISSKEKANLDPTEQNKRKMLDLVQDLRSTLYKASSERSTRLSGGALNNYRSLLRQSTPDEYSLEESTLGNLCSIYETSPEGDLVTAVVYFDLLGDQVSPQRVLTNFQGDEVDDSGPSQEFHLAKLIEAFSEGENWDSPFLARLNFLTELGADWKFIDPSVKARVANEMKEAVESGSPFPFKFVERALEGMTLSEEQQAALERYKEMKPVFEFNDSFSLRSDTYLVVEPEKAAQHWQELGTSERLNTEQVGSLLKRLNLMESYGMAFGVEWSDLTLSEEHQSELLQKALVGMDMELIQALKKLGVNIDESFQNAVVDQLADRALERRDTPLHQVRFLMEVLGETPLTNGQKEQLGELKEEARSLRAAYGDSGDSRPSTPGSEPSDYSNETADSQLSIDALDAFLALFG